MMTHSPDSLDSLILRCRLEGWKDKNALRQWDGELDVVGVGLVVDV